MSTDVLSPEKGNYGCAQNLLRQVAYDTLSHRDRKTEDRPPTPEEIAQAQVHATLALVNVTEGLLHELSTLRQHLSGN